MNTVVGENGDYRPMTPKEQEDYRVRSDTRRAFDLVIGAAAELLVKSTHEKPYCEEEMRAILRMIIADLGKRRDFPGAGEVLWRLPDQNEPERQLGGLRPTANHCGS